MSSSTAEKALEELTLGKGVVLEDLVEREELGELAQRAAELFGLSVRTGRQPGRRLADASSEPDVYTYLRGFKARRAPLGNVINAVKAVDPCIDGDTVHECITGARYLVRGIAYDSRPLGRLI